MPTRPVQGSIKFVKGLVLAGAVALGGCPDEVRVDSETTSDADTAAPDLLTEVDYGEGGVSVRYEPSSREFLATPWPTDRLRVDGHPDLTTFPNPDESTLLRDYIGYGSEVLDGWGRNSAIYFELSGLLDVTTLPTVEATLDDSRAALQLFAANSSSPRRGERVPLVFQQVDGEDDPYYPGPTLAMHPVYGFPLADSETYCAVILRSVKGKDGRHLAQTPAFAAALETEASLSPLRAMWSELDFSARDVAAATCFTTQDATKEMRAIERFLETRESGEPTELVYTGKTAHLHEIQGKYVTPNFQSGTKPYRNDGGDVKFDANGSPIVAEDEVIRFRLLIPRNSEMPAKGWPVILYSHGTFGDWQTCLDGSEQEAVREGLAMICIDQPLHGDRAIGSVVDYLDVFNFINPRSGRMTFRQSAIDTMWLSKMVVDGRFDFSADATAFGEDVVLDPDNIVFFGHSHGGLAGTIVLAADPRIKGAVLSGASGVLIETILRRKDPLDIEATLAAVLGLTVEQLDTFHPIMSLAQTLVDATDPVNYAPYWLEPVTGGSSKHVFMTEGTEDAASPAVGADAVAAAAGLPLLNPVVNPSLAHRLKGLEPVDMPVNSNLVSTTGALITGAIRQYEGGDHFVALTNEEAKQTWRGFFRAFREGDIPTIQR
jgi:pimeloyl-ACP methyl ester carboxylesterase